VADFNTCAKPEYPKSSLRNEETGTVHPSFLIGVDGRVMDSKITKSSGFRDLDKAAQAALGKCHFKPAMRMAQARASSGAGAVRLDAGIKTETANRLKL
jgi:protein TonB